MPDGHEQFNISLCESLTDVPAQSWDACAGTENPFLSHTFLSSLEDAGCITPETGWVTRHILIKDQHGTLLACAPLYLKGNSMGEYVFDWNWAEAFERAGGNYYPKLICAVPFTPATGPRLLVNGSLSPVLQFELKHQLVTAMANFASRAHLSSLHVNFISEDDRDVFVDTKYLHRVGIQYHWNNNDYQSYNDFLNALTSRKRKALKKERRLAKDGLTIHRLNGNQIQAHHWDAMYQFYMDTSTRKWGRPYLNREFFALLGERMAEQILLILAERDGIIIAGAMNLIGKDALFGRYWGCLEEIRFLHFELCYHQAIDEAIERGLKRVEAGAQGEHKIARGYLPVLTHSAHYIVDENFRGAIAEFLNHEKHAIEHEYALLMQDSPYRQS
ncbi:MAG: GNAT family N-acetyltransferase [Magnetovibrio sp.]|nr:GNAT family N-acetyltransferase [Magnetovibrio sp.]